MPQTFMGAAWLAAAGTGWDVLVFWGAFWGLAGIKAPPAPLQAGRSAKRQLFLLPGGIERHLKIKTCSVRRGAQGARRGHPEVVAGWGTWYFGEKN